MERFVCSSILCPCWPSQLVSAPSQLHGFTGSRNSSSVPQPPKAQLAFLIPWHSPSLLLTPGTHTFSLPPMTRGAVQDGDMVPFQLHVSFCKELQVMHSCKRAKHTCMLHSGSPALAATIPKYFPSSFTLCVHSLFPKVQDSLPELTLTQRFVCWLVVFCLGLLWFYFTACCDFKSDRV